MSDSGPILDCSAVVGVVLWAGLRDLALGEGLVGVLGALGNIIALGPISVGGGSQTNRTCSDAYI